VANTLFSQLIISSYCTTHRKAAGDFSKNVAGLVKDMHVESKDWHFNVESREKGVTVNVAIKLLITEKK
jgi:hypothetical protein